MKKFISVSLLVCMLFLTACVQKLTEEKLQKILNEKDINDISWSDFSNFLREVDKTSDKIWIYQLDNGSTLILQGSKDSDKPSVISIIEVGGESIFLKNESR